MKKLLGILGTIIVAGSGMTGIIGNASVSEKNEINYLQTSNLENLNRTKRNIHPSRLDIEYDSSSTWNKMIATFSPKKLVIFEDISQLLIILMNLKLFLK